MIDPDLKTQLDAINQNLAEIKKKTGNGGVFRSFFNGMFGALGYVLGLAIVIVILGWFLGKSGLLKPIQEQGKTFLDLIDSAKNLIPANSPAPAPEQKPASSTPTGGGQTTVTLPNGQQIKVNLPSGD